MFKNAKNVHLDKTASCNINHSIVLFYLQQQTWVKLTVLVSNNSLIMRNFKPILIYTFRLRKKNAYCPTLNNKQQVVIGDKTTQNCHFINLRQHILFLFLTICQKNQSKIADLIFNAILLLKGHQRPVITEPVQND